MGETVVSLKRKEIFLNNVCIFEVFGDIYLFGVNSLSIYKINKIYFNSLIKCVGGLENLSWIRQIIEKENFFLKQKDNLVLSSPPPFNKTKIFSELTLVVSQSCNMACKYCYLSDLLKQNEMMDWDVAKKSIDFFFSHSKNNIHISFFGGEPLLNFKLIEKSVQYASSLATSEGKYLSFDIITNGTIANQNIVDFFKEFGFDVGISLDGPKFIHDSLRIFPNGEGTFDVILKNIEKYYSQISSTNRIRFHIALHYPFYKYVSQLYDFFVDLEKKYKISFNRFGKINTVDSREMFKDTLSHFDDFIDMTAIYFKKVFEECESLKSLSPIFEKIRVSPQFLTILEYKKPQEKSLCGSGVKLLMVYPNGKIGGCRQLDPSFFPKAIWGDINFLHNINEENRLEPYYSNIKASERCNVCWLKNVCGGSCPAMNYYYNNNIEIPDPYSCEIQKTIFKLSVWLKDKLKEVGLWKIRKQNTAT